MVSFLYIIQQHGHTIDVQCIVNATTVEQRLQRCLIRRVRAKCLILHATDVAAGKVLKLPKFSSIIFRGYECYISEAEIMVLVINWCPLFK